MKKRVIVIGLDGLPKDLLDLLVKRGHFKNIANLLKEGVYRDLKSTIPPVTAPAWISFATGTSPKTHQCYDWVYPEGTINNFKPIDSRNIKIPTFYEILDKKGKKCILINMPATYPPKIKETVITGLLTKGNNCFFPKSLKRGLRNAKGYMIVPENIIDRKSKKYIKSVRKVEKKKFALAQELFKKKDWDFFFILFGASDWIQHGNYVNLLKKSPRSSLSWKVYEDLDRYIGWFKNNIKENDTFIIMSDHGFTEFEKVFFPNTWLKQKGLLLYGKKKKQVKWSKLSGNHGKKRLFFQDFILAFLGNFPHFFGVMKRLYFRIETLLPFELKSYAGSVGEKSKVYYLSNCIYLNDKNRFGNGVLNEKEHLRLKKKLISELKSLKLDGKKVFSSVINVTRKKTKAGRILPDIVVFSENFRVKEIRGPLLLNLPTQNHSKNGIFIGSGKIFKKHYVFKHRVSLIDLAPTILGLLDEKIPNYMEGVSFLR